MTGEERTKHAWLKGNLISVLLFLLPSVDGIQTLSFIFYLNLHSVRAPSLCVFLLCMLEVNTPPLCEALDFLSDEIIDVCF